MYIIYIYIVCYHVGVGFSAPASTDLSVPCPQAAPRAVPHPFAMTSDAIHMHIYISHTYVYIQCVYSRRSRGQSLVCLVLKRHRAVPPACREALCDG